MHKEFITIKITRNTYRKIFVDDIIYCKADRCYSIIKTVDTEFTYSKPLKVLEKLLETSIFIRVNRSYIINISKCIELKTGKSPQITLVNNEQMNVNPNCVNTIAKTFQILISEIN